MLNGEQGGDALAVLILPAHGVAWSLGGDHHDVDIGRGLDQSKADVEAVGKAEHLAGLEVRSDLGFIDSPLKFIGQQHHDPVGALGGLSHTQHLQSIGAGLGG